MTTDEHAHAMAPTRSPNRTVRVDPPLWNAALTTAARRGEKLSQAIRTFLEGYVKDSR